MNHDIQLVCFDLGGVLIRICRSWEEGCRAAGLAVRGESVIDPHAADGHHDLSRRHMTGVIDHDEFLLEVAKSRNDAYSIDEVRSIHHAWILGEYPGVGNMIDRIHGAGLRTAALSNTNQAHWVAMQPLATLRKLNYRLASHELGLVKPDAAIYREAEQRFGLGGNAILFFDDLIENVEAAKNIGWDAVQIDHTGDTAAQIVEALRDRKVL